MAVTYTEICNAVADVLRTISAISRVQTFSELSEDYPDLPLAQVYPDSGETDSWAGTADRSTFRAGGRVTETAVVVDIPCRQRSHVDLDMVAVLTVLEAVQNKLEEQDVKPYFALDGIKAFHWRWERVNFARGSPEVLYPGIRLRVTVTTF